mmetsp:Transcript_28795/g.55969  ORF Transcript_28795/g.55969 Transcript_28795/m.55969 type:complete len:84 (-) Transcript_28795:173-424(-)
MKVDKFQRLHTKAVMAADEAKRRSGSSFGDIEDEDYDDDEEEEEEEGYDFSRTKAAQMGAMGSFHGRGSNGRGTCAVPDCSVM